MSNPQCIKFAYSAIGWRSGLADAAKQIAGLGFAGVETFSLSHCLKRDQNLEQVLEETGLELRSTYFAGSFVDVERLEHEYADFASTLAELAKLRGKNIVVGGGRIRRGRPAEDWAQFLSAVRRLGAMAADAGIQLSFHPHAGTLVYTPEEIRRFAGEPDLATVRFAFDVAHLALGGGNVADLFREFSGRIGHVHLKDLSNDRHFVEMGRGTVPIQRVYAGLVSQGYRGWITIELDAADDAYVSACENVRYLRDTLGIKLDRRQLRQGAESGTG